MRTLALCVILLASPALAARWRGPFCDNATGQCGTWVTHGKLRTTDLIGNAILCRGTVCFFRRGAMLFNVASPPGYQPYADGTFFTRKSAWVCHISFSTVTSQLDFRAGTWSCPDLGRSGTIELLRVR